MPSPLFTIGHSNHALGGFLALLKQHGITALADVRSHPYSRHAPQYCRDPLKAALVEAGIAYVFLGKELGARSDNPACQIDGKVEYALLARQPEFAAGIKRLREGLEQHRIAVMCAEQDPLRCHRALLVAHELSALGVPILHIHPDGSLETQRQLEWRLLSVRETPATEA